MLWECIILLLSQKPWMDSGQTHDFLNYEIFWLAWREMFETLPENDVNFSHLNKCTHSNQRTCRDYFQQLHLLRLPMQWICHCATSAWKKSGTKRCPVHISVIVNFSDWFVLPSMLGINLLLQFSLVVDDSSLKSIDHWFEISFGMSFVPRPIPLPNVEMVQSLQSIFRLCLQA